jgi:hypothetical protein
MEERGGEFDSGFGEGESAYSEFWTPTPEERGEVGAVEAPLSIPFTGTVDELIKLYRGLTEKLKEFGYKNWNAYSRMFHSGQTPWLRFICLVEAETREEVQKSMRLREEITRYALNNYNVTSYVGGPLNDPENPEHFIGRGEPIHRLISAVRREFDPEGIMTPVMKKYTLLS